MATDMPVRKQPRRSVVALVTVIAGFLALSVLSAINYGFAIAAAIGVIGFAAVSMVIALTRKH